MKSIYQFIQEKLVINSKSKSAEIDPYDPSGWTVGSILTGTVGYNMVIPKFFEIIKKTPKGFTCVELSKKLAGGHYNGQFSEVPDESKHDEDLKGKKFQGRIKPNSKYVRVNNVLVHLWNGEPVDGDDMD